MPEGVYNFSPHDYIHTTRPVAKESPMKFAFHAGAPAELRCDLLLVPVFEGSLFDTSPLDDLNRRLEGLLGKLAGEEKFQAKKGQSLALHTHSKVGPERLLLVGLGTKEGFDAVELRHVAARAGKTAGVKHAAVLLPAGVEDLRSLQLGAEGALLGTYRFDRYLSEDARKPSTLELCTLVVRSEAAREAFGRAVTRAETIARAVFCTRDLINEPAGVMTPVKMAEIAQGLAKEQGLGIQVLGPAECRAQGMGMFLAVAQGSEEEPRFLHLTYTPKTPAKKRVCLIGKGVTFDSGGLSLKPSTAMEDMKVDMSGAATVLSAIGALAELGAPYEIHAICACTENMPSGKSYKLGDVLRSMAGKTVEINNTDAEGRLTLGDAIAYAKKLSPDEIFDFATLTGACVVALGPHTAGVMSNNTALAERWLSAAKTAGEEMWQLPLPERLKEQLKSDIADMKNTGERFGGALTAGLFLKEFVGDTAWVHVDVAGPASADKEYGAIAKGGTGFAVATLVEYLAPRS
jgi:leucyl aminopeptidase